MSAVSIALALDSPLVVAIIRNRARTPAENVPIPTELRDANGDGIKALTVFLKDFFAKSRQKHLHCIKFACAWPDYRSQYADLLGNLTLLGDMEAIAYQWQGRPHKNHNADFMLIRVQTTSYLQHFPVHLSCRLPVLLRVCSCQSLV